MNDQIITEALGRDRSVELNETTGEVTILDGSRGVTLSALQVLTLTGFLSQYDKVFFRQAWVLVEEQA
jgi:predicted RNA-binding protein Jag